LTNRGVVTTSNGNLTANAVNSGYGYALSTIPVSSGKYYCEISFEGTMAHSTNYNYIGIVPTDSAAIYTGQDIFRANGALSIDSDSSVIRGTIGTGSNDTNNTYQSSYGFDENDTIGIAIDCDTPQVTFYKNGTSIGTFPHTMQSNKSWYLFVNDWANAADFTGYILNAGQKPFKFSPPDGFQPINAANVRPETVISRPDQYVGIITHTQNPGAVKRYQTPGKFAPDLVWAKERGGSSAHNLFDTVRGATKRLRSNTGNAEDTQSNMVQAFHNDGFTYGVEYPNNSGQSGIYWCWKAGGNKNTFNVDDVGYQYYLQSPTGTSTPVYSGYCSGTQYSSTYSYAKAFDNSTSTVSFASNGNTITFTPPGGIANSGNILVTFDNGSVTDGGGSADFQINGSSVKSFFQTAITADGGGSGSSRVATITGITTITSMSWSRIADNDLFGVRKIVINGSETLTDGATIAPTGASVGTKQGFSIIKFTGSGSGTPSIPHGLSEAPTFIIQKDTEASTSWRAFAYDGSTWKIGNLNNTDSFTSATETAPTSSLFYANGNGNAANTQIAYLWHDVPGLQKFGTYEGSGVAGNYVHLGFRPALIWIKSVDTTSIQNWGIIDSTRSYANVGNHTLALNLDNGESAFGGGESVFGASNKIDLLSDGFVLRETSGFGNTSGITFLYCAWAEAPSIDLYGGGANAR
jgi:hypothetical protein